MEEFELLAVGRADPLAPGIEGLMTNGTLRIFARLVDNVTVLDLEGPFTLGSSSPSLGSVVRTLCEHGQLNILVNLGRVTSLDGAGLGELVSAFTQVTNSGGVMKLFNPTKTLRDALQVTKLYHVFDIVRDADGKFANEQNAIASFKPM